MENDDEALLEQEIQLRKDAEAIQNTVRSTVIYAFDEARNLVFANSNLTPQQVVDALFKKGLFERYYSMMTELLTIGLTKYPGLITQYSPVEIVTFRENGVQGGIVTAVPFDVERPRYPEQTSRAAAESYAAGLADEPAS